MAVTLMGESALQWCTLTLSVIVTLIGSTDGGCVFQRGYSPNIGSLCYLNGGRLMGRLDWQSNGNLVIYNDFNNVATWSTSTSGNPNSRLTFKTNGNLVIYGGNNNVLWASGTLNRGQKHSHFKMAATWSFMTPRMQQFGRQESQYPTNAKCIYRMGYTFPTANLCSNWNCHLEKYADGSMAITRDTGPPSGRTLWETYTQNLGQVRRAVFQTDGNFVIYNGANTVIWSSGTLNREHSLIFQDACSFVIYNSAGQAAWASGSQLEWCDCTYHSGGCRMTQPAPTGYQCECVYEGFWTCAGQATRCANGQITGACDGACPLKPVVPAIVVVIEFEF